MKGKGKAPVLLILVIIRDNNFEIFYFTFYINFSPCPALSGTATVSEQWFNKQIKVVAWWALAYDVS